MLPNLVKTLAAFMPHLWATKQKSKYFRPMLGRMQQNSGFFAKLPPAITSTNPNF